VRIGLVQINMGLTWSTPATTDESEAPSFGLLPYSVGLLKSYAIAHAAGRHEWLEPIYRRVPVAAGVAALEDADVAGFSVYVWNAQLSLTIARELKRRRPETLIVFGGPQVPERRPAAEAFLRGHPYVDIVCHGEGEAVFTAVLDRAAEREFDDVPGVSYLERSGTFVTHPKAPRIADLEQIPSPYLSGAFDDLIAARPNDRWVMIWETNRGCPFSCSFCDWGSATASKVFRFDMERLAAEIDWIAREKMGFVFCADANFGALKRDLELTEKVVESYQSTGFPFSFSVQSTKNATDRIYRIQKLLNTSLNAYGVTLALQSVNQGTLADINRANISSESYRQLQRQFAADGIYTYSDLILGLPGETYEEFASGISQVISDGQHNHIQFHNCSVLPNAEMGDPAYQERFGMQFVPQVIRNVHDRIEEDGWEVEESLDTVVGTRAMPPDDWRRAKVFAWMTDFAYFDRVLQIPLLVLHRRHGWPVHELIEAIVDADPDAQPATAGIVAALREKALSIQQGGPEYFPIPEAGGLLWPGDQRSLISLVVDDRIDAFYAEAGELLGAVLEARGVPDDRILLDEMLTLNRAALTLPFETENQLLLLSNNIWDHYQSLLVGQELPLKEGFAIHHVNRSRRNWTTLDDWAQHLSWAHGKDKRGYLRTVLTNPQRPAARAAAEALPAA
jgi:2-(S-pantetheinyl)-carbapenam-3-carboxylate methyltransferase